MPLATGYVLGTRMYMYFHDLCTLGGKTSFGEQVFGHGCFARSSMIALQLCTVFHGSDSVGCEHHGGLCVRHGTTIRLVPWC